MKINQVEMKEKLAMLLRNARSHAGKSQQYVADQMHVSRKTVQNWEDGINIPSMDKLFEYFYALDEQPFYYIFLYVAMPDTTDVLPQHTDAEIHETLIKVIDGLPADAQRKLLYLFLGRHGSDPIALLDLFTAYLQVPLKDRINIATAIENNYRIAEKHDNVLNKANIQPNIDFINNCYESAKKSVLDGKLTYVPGDILDGN